MQNLQTLIDLGFQKNLHGEYFWRGKHVTFTAVVCDYNGPTPFVILSKVEDQIDERPHSLNKGRHYKTVIKDCCSIGSVGRAIKKYDVPKVDRSVSSEFVDLYCDAAGNCYSDADSGL